MGRAGISRSAPAWRGRGAELFAQPGFQRVRGQLPSGQRAGVREPLEDEELAQQIRPHGGGVVSGAVERIQRAFQDDGAKKLLKQRLGGGKVRGIPGQHGGERRDQWSSANLAHDFTF